MITYRDLKQHHAELCALYDIASEPEVRAGLMLCMDQVNDMIERIVMGQEALGAYTMELLRRYHETEQVGEAPETESASDAASAVHPIFAPLMPLRARA